MRLAILRLVLLRSPRWARRARTPQLSNGLLRRYVAPPAGADETVRDAAIAALLRIPESAWPRPRAEPLARAIVAIVKEAPADRRTEPSLIQAIQFGDKLAALLPDDARRAVKKDLRALGVQVIPIATVPEQMLFDVKWFVVEAAKPVQIGTDQPGCDAAQSRPRCATLRPGDRNRCRHTAAPGRSTGKGVCTGHAARH